MKPAPPVTSTRIGARVVIRVECSPMRRLAVRTLIVVVLVAAAAIVVVLFGTCARTTLRGVPAAVGTDGVVLYTGAEAIGVLGPAELVRRAVAALRPVAPGAPSVLPAPNTQPRAALADCRSVPGPFEPVTGRLRRLLKSSGLPLVTAGTWFQDAQLTNAEQDRKSV